MFSGFFADVGGSYFLPRLPGSLGMFLALTGKLYAIILCSLDACDLATDRYTVNTVCLAVAKAKAVCYIRISWKHLAAY